jgi:hypothetical protein
MSGNGTTVIQGSSSYFAGDLILDGRTLTNMGPFIYFPYMVESNPPSTLLYGRNGAIFNNQTGATITLQGPTYFINDVGAAPTINNAGTFRAIPRGYPIDIEFVMNNTGTVQVDGGSGTIMTLAGGGTSTGTFTITSGNTLGFTGGTHYLIGATFNNSGTINFDGATVSLNSPTTIAGKVNLSEGTLTSTSTLTFTGPFNWSGGEMNGGGTTVTQGSTNYFYGDLILDGHTLTNTGTTVFSPYFAPGFYSNTHLYGRNGAIFNNQTGATVTLQGSTYFINDDGTSPTINNAGTFRAAPQTGSININFAMNNTGTVEVQKGTLNLQGGLTQLINNILTGGTWNVRANSTLNITTGINITTNQGTVTLDGVGSIFTKINTLANNQGNFSVLNGRNFTTVADLANSGTITVGIGSNFIVSGNLNNTGTVEVSGGTFTVNDSVAQFSGTTLTGGTWIARSNSTIDISTGSNITTNHGNVTLDGDESNFNKINTLADNQENFSVIGGRNFTTVADLANSGTLTVGSGSEFTVTGNLTGTGITIVDGVLTADSIVQNTLTIGDGATLTINALAGGPLGDGTTRAVPEPGTLIMLLIAAVTAGWLRKSVRRIGR